MRYNCEFLAAKFTPLSKELLSLFSGEGMVDQIYRGSPVSVHQRHKVTNPKLQFSVTIRNNVTSPKL